MGALTENIFARLLDQQKDGENWNKLCQIIADEFEEVVDVLTALSTQLWKDTAEGVWLDRVGEIVGLSRPGEEEVDNLFTVCDVGEPGWEDEDLLHGWGTTANPSQGGILYSLDGVQLGVAASDVAFRAFVEVKIAATNADASIPGIARYINAALGVACTVTSEVGRVTIELPSTGYDMRQRRYCEMLCPVVAGVDVVFLGYPEI